MPGNAPFLCKTYVSPNPINVRDGFSPAELPIKEEYAVYVECTVPLLEVVRNLWTILPPTYQQHRARYALSSIYHLQASERYDALWKSRNLGEFGLGDVLGRHSSEDRKDKSLRDCGFKTGDLLYLRVILPVIPQTAQPQFGNSLNIKGTAKQPLQGGMGAPDGSKSWNEARRDDPPADRRRMSIRGRGFAGGMGGSTRDEIRRPTETGATRHFDLDRRDRSRSPRRPSNNRRPSPSY